MQLVALLLKLKVPLALRELLLLKLNRQQMLPRM
jgi:hypothetical protein